MLFLGNCFSEIHFKLCFRDHRAFTIRSKITEKSHLKSCWLIPSSLNSLNGAVTYSYRNLFISLHASNYSQCDLGKKQQAAERSRWKRSEVLYASCSIVSSSEFTTKSRKICWGECVLENTFRAICFATVISYCFQPHTPLLQSKPSPARCGLFDIFSWKDNENRTNWKTSRFSAWVDWHLDWA